MEAHHAPGTRLAHDPAQAGVLAALCDEERAASVAHSLWGGGSQGRGPGLLPWGSEVTPLPGEGGGPRSNLRSEHRSDRGDGVCLRRHSPICGDLGEHGPAAGSEGCGPPGKA